MIKTFLNLICILEPTPDSPSRASGRLTIKIPPRPRAARLVAARRAAAQVLQTARRTSNACRTSAQVHQSSRTASSCPRSGSRRRHRPAVQENVAARNVAAMDVDSDSDDDFDNSDDNNSDDDNSEFDELIESNVIAQKRRKKRTNPMKNYDWDTDAPRPTITPIAAQLLVTVASIAFDKNLGRLNDLIRSLQSSTTLPNDTTNDSRSGTTLPDDTTNDLQSDTALPDDTTNDSLFNLIGRVEHLNKISATLDLTRISDFIKLALLIDR